MLRGSMGHSRMQKNNPFPFLFSIVHLRLPFFKLTFGDCLPFLFTGI